MADTDAPSRAMQSRRRRIPGLVPNLKGAAGLEAGVTRLPIAGQRSARLP
jgi:hypothetical protein